MLTQYDTMCAPNTILPISSSHLLDIYIYIYIYIYILFTCFNCKGFYSRIKSEKNKKCISCRSRKFLHTLYILHFNENTLDSQTCMQESWFLTPSLLLLMDWVPNSRTGMACPGWQLLLIGSLTMQLIHSNSGL